MINPRQVFVLAPHLETRKRANAIYGRTWKHVPDAVEVNATFAE